MDAPSAYPAKSAAPFSRWLLLAAAVVVMMVIGVYQYSWFLFSFGVEKEYGWDLAAIGLVYTAFHYTSTLVMPFSGYLADSRGPRRVATVAAAVAGAGLILCAVFPSPLAVMAGYCIGGVGVGMLYGVSTAIAIKWFPDRRGFATGCVVFGFGAGTALLNPAIEVSLEQRGVAPTLLGLGSMMLVLLLPLAQAYRYPAREVAQRAPTTGHAVLPKGDFTPGEMLRTRQWYVMYIGFSITISIVLIFGAQMKVLAREYALPSRYFQLLLVMFPLANGCSRLVAGWVSDRLGRIVAMQRFFALLGLSILGLVSFGHVPELFCLFVILAALFGGAPFVLYPAAIGDFYGSRYSTANYGITYTAKAWAGLISGWLSGYIMMRFGSLKLLLIAVGISSLGAALMCHPRLLNAPARRHDGPRRAPESEPTS